MKKCNRVQLNTITNYDYPMSAFQYTLVGIGSPIIDVLSNADCDEL